MLPLFWHFSIVLPNKVNFFPLIFKMPAELSYHKTQVAYAEPTALQLVNQATGLGHDYQASA